MIKGLLALIASTLALTFVGAAIAASALFLTMKEARRQANIFARHVAIQANDDGYHVGVCSWFSNVNVHCSAHNWATGQTRATSTTATTRLSFA